VCSYARHLLRVPHPKYADAVPVSVKIYRVQHRILTAEQLAMGENPKDGVYYLPYYQGQYDPDGRLMDPDDPFLFWCLPIVHKTPNDPKSPLLCYVFKHAGAPDWERPSLR